MQNEEKSKLEERIIAYFDGSLDGEGSRSLLREVAESPEKRAIFKGHETLTRLIAAAREPLEAPLEVKQSLADRIPGMIAFLPGLFGAAETAPIITQSTNPFIAFFTRMSLTTAVSIGGAVALLVTGIFLPNEFDSHSTRPAASRIAVVQNQAPVNISPNRVASTDRTNGSDRTERTNPIRYSISQHGAPAPVTALDINDAGEDNTPLASLTEPVPTIPVTAGVASIPTQTAQTLLALTVEAKEGITIKPYIAGDERILSVNGIGTKDQFQPESGFLAGLDFDLGDRYVFHVQGGSGYFTTVSRNLVRMFAGVPEYKLTSQPTQGEWASVGLSYPVLTIGSTPIIVSGDVGTVFLNNFNNLGYMARVGAATEIPISLRFALRPSVTYDEVMTSLPPLTGNLIYVNPVANRPVLSSAFGINVGLVLHY